MKKHLTTKLKSASLNNLENYANKRTNQETTI